MNESVFNFILINPKDKFIKTNESMKNSLFYYDMYSKKTILFHEKGIKIFNKSATNIKKDIDINLPKNRVKLLTIDKNINYMLILYENKQKILQILILDLNNNTVIDILQKNFHFLIGMFFINKNNFNNNNNNNNEIHFCLLYLTTLSICSIDISTFKITEIVNKHLPSHFVYKTFSFNSQFNILLCAKTDNTFDIYNLSKPKFYNNSPINLTFSSIAPIKVPYSIFSGYKSIDYQQKERILSTFFTRDRYTENQFILECLYDNLHLIILNYEKNLISVYVINNLNEIKEVCVLSYSKHSHLSAIQVVDNLIVVHNFALKSLVAIDIKSKKKIINISSFVDFQYEKNFFVNGSVFEERFEEFNNKNKNNIVYENNLFNVTFDLNKYEKISFVLHKKYKNNDYDDFDDENNENNNENNDKKDKRFLSLYEIYYNIIHRKNSTDIFIKGLFNLIKNDENSNVILNLFKEIVAIIKNNNPKNLFLINNNNNLNENESKNLIYPFDIILKHKKNNITQRDIFYKLFTKFENENFDEKIWEKIIIYLIQFKNMLIFNDNNNNEFLPYYNKIMLIFIKKIKNQNFIFNLINNDNNNNNNNNFIIPENLEIAKYFLSQKNFCLIGIDMLLKMKNYNEILDYFIKNKSLLNSIELINKIKKFDDFSEIFNNNSQFIINNNNNNNNNKNIILNLLK